MNTFAIITNTIRRDVSFVEKSLRASLSQPGVESVILVDQNQEPLVLSSDLLVSPRLKVMNFKVPSVSAARNLAEYPLVDWLIFCDDDGYMANDFLQNLKAEIVAHPQADVICGSIKRIDNNEFYSKRHSVGGDMSRFWNAKLLMGSNFCVKRTVFEKLGKFDEKFGAGAKFGSSEETDFAWNAFFNRCVIIFSRELVVFHVPPFAGELGAEFRKSFRYGIGKGALVRKWLFKGHPIVFVEFFEMLTLPSLRGLMFLVSGAFKESIVQIASVLGRILGLFRY